MSYEELVAGVAGFATMGLRRNAQAQIAQAGVAWAEISEETAGPFLGDSTNGPNVLTASGIVRRVSLQVSLVFPEQRRRCLTVTLTISTHRHVRLPRGMPYICGMSTRSAATRFTRLGYQPELAPRRRTRCIWHCHVQHHLSRLLRRTLAPRPLRGCTPAFKKQVTQPNELPRRNWLCPKSLANGCTQQRGTRRARRTSSRSVLPPMVYSAMTPPPTNSQP